MITKLQLRVFVFLINILVPSAVAKNCNKFSSPHYLCNEEKPEQTCTAYALLRPNSHYSSSLSNPSSYFTINPTDLAEANAFAENADFLSVLVPIKCKCTHGGLTSCKAIREKNPSLSNVEEKTEVFVPLKLQDRNVGHPAQSRATEKKRRRKRKKLMIGVYITVGIVGFGGMVTTVLFIHWRKKKCLSSYNGGDVEQQQLSLSIRTTSDKKVSFEESSQHNFDEHTTTPHKTRVESYTFEDLQKATHDFCSENLIQSSVFHGRHKGKNLAIKRVKSIVMSKINSRIFQHNANVVGLLGTCAMDGPDSFLVLEYARNGSLKDWIHGGLAIKSQFIASCSCFLSWNQRLKICVDVATALQYMHHIMNPSYVHGNIRSRNVYLDEDFNAKLGMPKLSDDKEEKGYMAPEGTISPSTDIFAYSVVLLEVLSGKPPTTLCDEIKEILQSEDAEKMKGWMDSGLGESYSFDGAVKLGNIARSCVEEDPSARPNAGEIMDKLLRLVEESPVADKFNMCESSCRPLVL